jgi:hypothetical protein
MIELSRRAFGLATLAGGAQGAKKPGAPMPTQTTLRATVTADGTTAGEQATILVDGADTEVTANGVAGYVPEAGDRVLVQQVGGQIEILQFIGRTTITGQTIQTAPNGARWVIASNTAPYLPDTIQGYTGVGGETVPATINVVSAGTNHQLRLEGPKFGFNSGSISLSEDTATVRSKVGLGADTIILDGTLAGAGVIISGDLILGGNGVAFDGLQHGSVNVPLLASQVNSAIVTVTYPNGAFGATPRVWCEMTAGSVLAARVVSKSASQIQLQTYWADQGAGHSAVPTLNVDWFALGV